MNIITKINDYFLKNCIEDRNVIGDNFYDYCEFEEETNSILFYSDCILTGIFHCDDYSFEDLSTSFTDYVDFCQFRDYIIKNLNV